LNNTLIFRDFNFDDLDDVLTIYNYHIINGLANFEEEILSREKFLKICELIIDSKLPFLVCESKLKLVGFAYLSNFRNKSGYRFAFENTIYLDNEITGKGIGSTLLANLILSSKKNNSIKTIISVIGGYNPDSSIQIHKKNGFKMIGTLKNVEFKKNKWIDSIYMQLELK